MKRIVHLILTGLVSLCLSGCLVAESRYLQKADEADNLSKELASLKQRHADLAADNSTLLFEFKKLKGEDAVLGKENAALAKDRVDLEQLLKARSDELSRSIIDLRQKVAALEAENKRLKDDITALQRIKAEKVKEVSNTYELLLQSMKSEIAQGQVTISELKGKLTVTIEEAILFDSGRFELRDDGLEILQKLVETLKGFKDKAIRIEGHTDNVPVSSGLTSQFPTNWELSAARAINVTKYLQLQGLDPTVLSAAAFAEFRPVAGNDSKEGRAKNRRIEITLMARD